MSDKITLDNPIACRQELERCSNGMATLLTQYIRAREAQVEVKREVRVMESIAAEQCAEKGITATEMRARMTLWLHEEGLTQYQTAGEWLDADMDVLERRFRNLEKRQSAAQSALNDHQREAQFAGHGSDG